MPRGNVNMPPSSSRLSPAHHLDLRQRADRDIDIDISEHLQDDVPMSDKVTPPQPRHTRYPGDAADAKQGNKDNLAGWQIEIQDRIKEYPVKDLGEYLAKMVPSDEPVPTCPEMGNMLQAIPVGNFEIAMYNPLVAALTQMVKEFPRAKRPKFSNYDHKIMKFPFECYQDEEHPTKPDVIATVPARSVITPEERWRNMAVVFELKNIEKKDPMYRSTPTHWETLVQLAKSARNIMLSQGRLYAFVVGIYGDVARIFRFDRAGAICSAPFAYRDHPEILHEFLWRLFHPRTQGCAIVGEDPTMKLGTSADRKRVVNLARKHDPDWKHSAETRKAVRRITMLNEKGERTTYLAYKLLFVNPGLFSRATLIWEAFIIDKNNRSKGERCVLKETWRQLCRLDEIGFYEMLQLANLEKFKEEQEKEGRARKDDEAQDADGKKGKKGRRAGKRGKCVVNAASNTRGAAASKSGDATGGSDEARQKLLAEARALGDAQHTFGVVRFMFGEDFGQRDEEQWELTEKARVAGAPLPEDTKTGYRTISGVHNCPAKVRLNERSQTRMVLKTIGTPLTDFECTREVVTALRDAVEGHRQAYEDGVIHRDISEGNVMIARLGEAFAGFIQDLDFSFSWRRFLEKRNYASVDLATWEKYCVEHGHEPPQANDVDPANNSKERTGTVLFMAVQVLLGKITHEARHDLESFYWLLVFIVLRHTKHGHAKKNAAFASLFCSHDLEQCASHKMTWLLSLRAPLDVPDNEPLSTLLEDLRALFDSNFPDKRAPIRRVTHQEVLDVFNNALAKDWPLDDASVPWVSPLNRQYPGSMVESIGKPVTKGTLDHTVATELRFPVHTVPQEQIAADRELDGEGDGAMTDDDSCDSADDVHAEASDENMVTYLDDSERPNAPDAPPGLALLITDEPQPEASTSKIPEQKRNESRTRKARTNSRTEQPPPKAKRQATKTAGSSRNVAETWPAASNVDGVGARPGQRYNLRSSSRRDLTGSNTSDAADRAPVPERRSTRSRTQASQQRDAGSRNSSIGKRSREREDLGDIEEDLDAQSSKRPRTLSQPRGRKPPKKSGKKP
ncbi:uncharacterized protein C8Q71DRAFT_285114 [Rhodofomes roseus]|uniref:Fungal-type protein kinase domain-containing protein n=1 Tax=Rhodofomes roseus TaxID=34475 RepID=A0ABQ8K505_9APHY|nr:uncharacterized protein C8Q71DRAFT_285114 [Rhodofomes roseus]KAH9831786.1 hypothetical protein C8Q71DRAFT_285114 [Rhodofomes roseus]